MSIYTRVVFTFFFAIISSTLFAQNTSVEFRFNLNHQIELGNFDPSTDFVDIAGTFNNWGAQLMMLSDADSDGIYTRSIMLSIGETVQFKGRINGDWNGREEFPGGGPNRLYTVEADGIVEVWYNDEQSPDALGVRIYASSIFIEPGESIQFVDQSTGNPIAWEWSFPGGTPSSSTLPNPVVTYPDEGSYEVSLAIEDADGVTADKTFQQYVRVGTTTTKWWNNTVFYEVFVRSFKDSDGDGRGDFRGLIDKLDYLNDGDPNTDTDLGVTGIWLMPIQQSPSYHGYDVTDYRTIERDYGTNEDFKTFMTEAHNRGIKVIIDLVMNHTSSQHPWFSASTNPNSDKREWYRWESSNPRERGPWGQNLWHNRNGDYYYGLFWSGMPDLNFATPEVKTEIFDIARFWLEEMDVDGFRLDAVKYIYENDMAVEDIPETIQFWKDFRQYYKQVNPEAFSVGEAWTTTEKIRPYVNDEGLDYCFEFDLASAMLNTANTGNARFLQEKMTEVIKAYPYLQFGTFLTNHDQNRIMDVLGYNTQKAKLAADLLLTLPGIPYLYYGEEIGMTGVKPDEQIRTPLLWTDETHAGFTNGSPWIGVNSDYRSKNIAAQQNDPNSLWQHYRTLIKIRQEENALSLGNYRPVLSTSEAGLAFLRQYQQEQILVVSNVSDTVLSSLSLSLPYAGILPGSYRLEELQGGAIQTIQINANGGFSDFELDSLAARTTRIYRFAATTSTEPAPTGLAAKVFPNPASQELNIQLASPYPSTYQLVDLLGRVVLRGQMAANPTQLSTSGLASGAYQLVLKNEFGTRTFPVIIQQ